MRDLILPCETRVREFDAKLLLGLLATTRGISAVVGAKKSIDLALDRYPAGVYVGKSLTARSRHNLQLARACGHRVALWDEEGLVWASREVYWRTKVDAGTLNEAELMLAWGEDNARVWREHPDYRGGPIAAVGNPRADLLHPRLTGLFAEEVEAIRGEYGQFILINTNFSRVNHVQPRQNRHLKWLREQRPDDPRGGFAAHKYALFQAFRETVPRLARALPELNFVLRPHPSEDRSTWESIGADLDNLSVAQHGNVVAWLLASRGLVHNGCTTAIEAYQLGRPALAFRPVQSADFDHPLPNGVSLNCNNFAALSREVGACATDPAAVFARQSSQAGPLMAAALTGVGEFELASERILDALEPLLQAAPGRPPGIGMRLAMGLRRAFRRIEHYVPGSANYRPYLAHMFPNISIEEVQARLRRQADALGLSAVPALESLGNNVFRLCPARLLKY